MNTIVNHYRLLRVSGRDHLDFLHRMLSSDVTGMAVESVCPSALLAINGRVIATLILIRTVDSIEMLIHPSLSERVSAQLNQMRFRSQVNITPVIDAQLLGYLNGPVPSPAPGSWALSQHQSGRTIHWPEQLQLWIGDSPQIPPDDVTSTALSDEQWSDNLIELGHCWITDQTSDQYVAQMIDLHHGPAISFRKGCFPGQEVVARIRYKGRVKRSVYHCQSATPLTLGCSLTVGERRLGEVINSSGDQALAVLSNDLVPDDAMVDAATPRSVQIKRVHPVLRPETPSEL